MQKCTATQALFHPGLLYAIVPAVQATFSGAVVCSLRNSALKGPRLFTSKFVEAKSKFPSQSGWCFSQHAPAASHKATHHGCAVLSLLR